MNDNAKLRRILIDTDTGGDDAAAIILAARTSGIHIEGVTVSAGNVALDQAVNNALMSLEIAGCHAPVYAGSSCSLSGTFPKNASVFGLDGMGDAGIVHPSGSPADGDAVDFILDTVRKYPGEIEIAALAPATNLAKAIRKDPQTMKKVNMIWSMGTSGFGKGNVTPFAEFNVYQDPEAYRILLDAHLPLTIIGLDMCSGEAKITDAQLNAMKNGTPRQAFVATALRKLSDVYHRKGEQSFGICDAVAVSCMVLPGFMREKVLTHGECITTPCETLGMVHFTKAASLSDALSNTAHYNAGVVTGIDGASFFRRYMDAIK